MSPAATARGGVTRDAAVAAHPKPDGKAGRRPPETIAEFKVRVRVRVRLRVRLRVRVTVNVPVEAFVELVRVETEALEAAKDGLEAHLG